MKLESEIDFGGEVVIVLASKTKEKGFLKFKRKIDEVFAEYKEEEKEKEVKKMNRFEWLCSTYVGNSLEK